MANLRIVDILDFEEVVLQRVDNSKVPSMPSSSSAKPHEDREEKVVVKDEFLCYDFTKSTLSAFGLVTLQDKYPIPEDITSRLLEDGKHLVLPLSHVLRLLLST